MLAGRDDRITTPLKYSHGEKSPGGRSGFFETSNEELYNKLLNGHSIFANTFRKMFRQKNRKKNIMHR